MWFSICQRWVIGILGHAMLEKGDVVIWDSSETVYEVGDKGFEAYLIMEGTVGNLTLIDCPNELVLIEFERWMRGSGYSLVP